MFITLTTKRLAIHSFTFWIGWHNLEPGGWSSWHQGDGQANTLDLIPGLYNFELLSPASANSISDLTIDVDKATGMLSLSVPRGNQTFISKGTNQILGLGDRPVNSMPQDALFVHFDQIYVALTTF